MDKRDALIDQLLVENKHLQARIAELEKRLGLNSKNSGKPPSSDGLNKPPRVNTRSLRKKGKKPSGGQSGHPGTTLKQVTHPDKTLLPVLSHCPDCAMDLKNHEVKGIMRRQVFDISEPRIEITEHQAEIKYCTGCNHKVQASFPETVNTPVQYGPKIKSYAVYSDLGL
jgi:transposase